jgi:hypothetical protein
MNINLEFSIIIKSIFNYKINLFFKYLINQFLSYLINQVFNKSNINVIKTKFII